MPWLSLAILFPIVCALGIPLLPEGNKVVRWYGLGASLITFLITVAGYLKGYDPAIEGLQMAERISWVPQLGLTWSCLLYTSPSPRDGLLSRMPSSA